MDDQVNEWNILFYSRSIPRISTNQDWYRPQLSEREIERKGIKIMIYKTLKFMRVCTWKTSCIDRMSD